MNRFFAFLGLQKLEKIGIFVLIFFISAYSFARYSGFGFGNEKLSYQLVIDSALNESEWQENSNFKSKYSENAKIAEAEYSSPSSFFDPNAATMEQLIEAGLRPKLAKSIFNFRNAGAKFRKKEDLRKLYALKDGEFEIIEPFIQIAENGTTTNFQKYEKPTAKIVELNAADSVKLLEIRGVGPYFAGRIIKLKNSFGGFYAKEQLYDLYKIDSAKIESWMPYVSVDSTLITKIKINQCTVEEINKHPYIGYSMANALIKYRAQNGQFANFADVLKIYGLDVPRLSKVKPYLNY